MNRLKKLISVLLAVLLLASMSAFTTGVMAQSPDETDSGGAALAPIQELNAFAEALEETPVFDDEILEDGYLEKASLLDLTFEKGTLIAKDSGASAYTFEDFTEELTKTEIVEVIPSTYEKFLEQYISMYEEDYGVSFDEVKAALAEMGYTVSGEPTDEEIFTAILAYDFLTNEMYEDYDVKIPEGATLFDIVKLYMVQETKDRGLDIEIPDDASLETVIATMMYYSFYYEESDFLEPAPEDLTYEDAILTLYTQFAELFEVDIPEGATLEEIAQLILIRSVSISYDIEIPEDTAQEDLPYVVLRELVIKECGEESAPEGASAEELFNTLAETGYFDYAFGEGPFYSDVYDYDLVFDSHESQVAVSATFWDSEDEVTINGLKIEDEKPVTLDLNGVEVIKIEVKDVYGSTGTYTINVINPEEDTQQTTAPTTGNTTVPPTTIPVSEDVNPDTSSGVDTFAILAMLLSAAVFTVFSMRCRKLKA